MYGLKLNLFTFAAFAATFAAGCRSYEPNPIDWEIEARCGVTNVIRINNLSCKIFFECGMLGYEI